MSVQRRVVVLLALASVAAFGCNTYRDQLARGQRAFDQNDHDHAIALLRDIEPDLVRLSPAEQAQYAYVRGMSDYRVGYSADARHWLALAKAYEEKSPGALSADWKTRTDETLAELNAVVYSEGIQALSLPRRASESEEGSGKAKRESKRPASESQ